MEKQATYLRHLNFTTEDRKTKSEQHMCSEYTLALSLARNFTQTEKMINDGYIMKSSFHMPKQTFPKKIC